MTGLDRAKELLSGVDYAAMATTNRDGSPHNTPYKFFYSSDLRKLYWGSHPDSQHSKNVERSSKVFVVLYEANAKGGLYIQASDAKELEGVELEEALDVQNEIRQKKEEKAPLVVEYYQQSDGQRMYGATIDSFWINDVERDADGLVIKDKRVAIDRELLI